MPATVLQRWRVVVDRGSVINAWVEPSHIIPSLLDDMLCQMDMKILKHKKGLIHMNTPSKSPLSSVNTSRNRIRLLLDRNGIPDWSSQLLWRRLSKSIGSHDNLSLNISPRATNDIRKKCTKHNDDYNYDIFPSVSKSQVSSKTISTLIITVLSVSFC